MEKERRVKVLSLVALIVAVLGLTVAFAALSQTLTINGSANMDTATWDIHIENLKVGTIIGDAQVITEPTISSDGKSIENFKVSLTKPGDYVSYTFDFVNNGTIDAENTNIITNGIDESSITSEDDIPRIASALFAKADWDGDGVTTDEEKIKALQNIGTYHAGTSSSNIGEIKAGNSKNITIAIFYEDDSTELPKGEVELNLNIQYVFSQK